MTESQPDAGPATLQEVADRLGVHYMTVYRYVRLGILPASKEGGQWQVAPEDLEAFIAARAADAGVSPRSIAADWPGRYLRRATAGDLTGAWQVVEAALASGVTPDRVYTTILVPALHDIGERWARGELSIAEEHRASAVTTRLLGRMSARWTRRGRPRGTVVMGTAQRELHSLPAHLAADLLRGEGYDVVDLGAYLPPESFVEAVSERSDLTAVVVSATTPDQDEDVSATIDALRSAMDDETPVLIGGGAIRDAEHAEDLGAEWVPTFDALVTRLVEPATA